MLTNHENLSKSTKGSQVTLSCSGLSELTTCYQGLVLFQKLALAIARA